MYSPERRAAGPGDDRRRDGPPPDRTSANRRRFLQATGAAGIAALTAGCQSVLPPLGGGVNFGRVDVPAPGAPIYRSWMPAPDAFRDPDPADGYAPVHSMPARWYDERPAPVTSIGTVLASNQVDWLGYEMVDFERVVAAGPVRVLLGDLDPDTIVEALAAGEYEYADSYGDFQLYARTDDRYAAVADERVLWSDEPEGAHEIRRVVDARNGDVERYHEVDEEFSALSDRAGASVDTVFGLLGYDPTDEAIGGAYSLRSSEDALFYVQDVLYPDGVDVPVGAIEDELEDFERHRDADAVDVERIGRIASVQTRISNERARSDVDVETARPVPWITWEHERAGKRITFRHVAGQSVEAEYLRIVTADEDLDVRQWAEEYETVGPGDELTVTIDTPVAGGEVELLYEMNEEQAVTIYRVEVEGRE